MDTKYLNKLPDTLDRLLKSTNIDDVVLGVILTRDKMGAQWIKENFLFNRWSKEDRWLLNLPDKEEMIIRFKDICVLVGSICLQALTVDDMQHHRKKPVIYEE